MADVTQATPMIGDPSGDAAGGLRRIGGRLGRSGAQGSGRLFVFLKESGILIALILLIIAGSLMSPHFLTASNFANVFREVALAGILGIGMTFVILTAGIDLSVGSILGFSGVAGAIFLSQGLPWPVGVILGLLAGAFVGALNGLGVTKGKLPPFIMTLGMLVIARGVTMTYTEGQPIPLRPHEQAFAWVWTGAFLRIPVPVWIMLLTGAVAAFTLRYTSFGRHVYAVGDNIEAARLSGINTDRVLFNVYVISGLCSAITGLILVSKVRTGLPKSGEGWELIAIAIVVIGGTSLFGGEGSIRGTMIGAAIVGIVNNLLNLIGVSSFSQNIVRGAIILGAVLVAGQSITRRQTERGDKKVIDAPELVASDDAPETVSRGE
ncbi:MAG TPA: ABC transporter permease [Euzebya sp.]|nr:ABC transporter permease [Euzebya sp.]